MQKLINFNLATKQAIESWTFPNVALCRWKINKLKETGNYSQGFKIEKA